MINSAKWQWLPYDSITALCLFPLHIMFRDFVANAIINQFCQLTMTALWLINCLMSTPIPGNVPWLCFHWLQDCLKHTFIFWYPYTIYMVPFLFTSYLLTKYYLHGYSFPLPLHPTPQYHTPHSPQQQFYLLHLNTMFHFVHVIFSFFALALQHHCCIHLCFVNNYMYHG